MPNGPFFFPLKSWPVGWLLLRAKDPASLISSGPSPSLAVDRWFVVRPGVSGSCWGTGRDSEKADHARWRRQSEAGRIRRRRNPTARQVQYSTGTGSVRRRSHRHTDRSMGFAACARDTGTWPPDAPAPRAAGSAPPGAMSRRPRPRLCMQSETATRSPAASACCGTVPDCMPGQHIYRERESTVITCMLTCRYLRETRWPSP